MTHDEHKTLAERDRARHKAWIEKALDGYERKVQLRESMACDARRILPIIDAMMDSGLSQKKAAEMIGVTGPAISQIRSGLRQTISDKMILAVERSLGVSREYFTTSHDKSWRQFWTVIPRSVREDANRRAWFFEKVLSHA